VINKSELITFFSQINNSNIFAIIAAMTILLIFVFIFHSAIYNTSIPRFNNAVAPSLRVPDGFVFKAVKKNGWHPCVEDPGVFCNGPYYVNQTIQKYQNLTPPPAKVIPQAFNTSYYSSR
jgi:hypothetical protein